MIRVWKTRLKFSILFTRVSTLNGAVKCTGAVLRHRYFLLTGLKKRALQKEILLRRPPLRNLYIHHAVYLTGDISESLGMPAPPELFEYLILFKAYHSFFTKLDTKTYNVSFNIHPLKKLRGLKISYRRGHK